MSLNYIVQAPMKKVFNFNLKNESFKELELIGKVYFNQKLEKEYKLDELAKL